MKLFLISQEQNDNYDTYSGAVVAAPNEDIARVMNPRNGQPMDETGWNRKYSPWCSGPEHVIVRYLGEAMEGVEVGLICASFHAG